MSVSGPRLGVPTWPRRLLARAVAADLTAFVVPDTGLARTGGLDLAAVGLRPVATPRHATVLLVVGDMPPGLASAAGVAYAQMPRPRAILAVGTTLITGLPTPDAVASLDQDDLAAGVAELRRRLAAGAFAVAAPALDLASLRSRTEYVCPMHSEVVRDEPGACPICGMDLVRREAEADAPGHDHAATGMAREPDPAAALDAEQSSGERTFICPMHPEVVQDEPGSCPICGMRLEPTTAGEHSPAHLVSQHRDAESGDGAGSSVDDGTGHPAGSVHGGHAGQGDRHVARDETAAATTTDSGPVARHGTMMDHAAHDAAGSATAHAIMAHDASAETTETTPPIASVAGAADRTPDDQATMDHAAMGHGDVDQAPTDHAAIDSGDMDHGMMDHSMHGGGFMSMVAMTQDLPRSRDGLPMEWIEVPFGPLCPGLPGGLVATFTLDGDAVARATVGTETVARGLKSEWPGPAETFPERLARLDPLAPVAYRLLARRALEAVAGVAVDETTARRRVRGAESERVGSHLGWLAEFASLLGDHWLARRSAELQLVMVRAGVEGAASLADEIRGFLRAAARLPLLDRRLAGIGATGSDAADRLRGPVARAAGCAVDARTDDATYRDLGFTPVVAAGGDAFARLRVRLGEIGASLDLILALGAEAASADSFVPSGLSGSATVAVETPRGAARLHVVLEGGAVVAANLDPPSARHIDLVPEIIAGAEVADALAAIASLDLSPWEVTP